MVKPRVATRFRQSGRSAHKSQDTPSDPGDLHLRKKSLKLSLVKFAIGPDTGANIYSLRPHEFDSSSHVPGSNSARKKNRNVHQVNDFPAGYPVVRLPCPTEYLLFSIWISGIK